MGGGKAGCEVGEGKRGTIWYGSGHYNNAKEMSSQQCNYSWSWTPNWICLWYHCLNIHMVGKMHS